MTENFDNPEVQGLGEDEAAPKREIGVEELGNLVSAFGNHEAKALTLAVMQPGIIYNTSRLWNRLIEVQGSLAGWKLSRGIPFEYCLKSLSPIGLVTREIVNHDLSTYGYEITPYGAEIGLALDGHLLDWSLRHDKSLYDVFGSTSTSGQSEEITVGEETMEFKKRAPFTRLKIFWELLTSPSLPIRETDLATQIGTSEGLLQGHLESLDRSGVIDYRAIGMDKPYAYYKLSENRPDIKPQYKEDPTLAARIYSLFTTGSDLEASAEDTYQKLIEAYPEYRDSSNRDMMVIRIRGILPELESKKYLTNSGFRRDIKSEISLSEEQKIMLYELLEVIDRFRSGDRQFWQEGRDKARTILVNPESVAKLMQKIKESSPSVNKVPSADLGNWLATLLIEHPDATARQLQQYLEEVYGKKLIRERILQVLRSQERFVPEKSHHSVSWRVITE